MPEGTGYDQIANHLTEQEESEARAQEAAQKKAQTKALVQKWADKVKRTRRHDNHARIQWADDRRVARGDPKPGEQNWLVHTNLIAAILEVLAAFLYAKNPDISTRPSESANRKLNNEYRAVAETLEIIVSRMLHDAGLKRTAKRWVRAAMTVGVSWIKAAMQTGTSRDPLIEKKINDLKQNQARLQALQSKLEDGEQDDNDETLAEIDSQIIALEGQLERQVAQGVVLDLMAPEDVVVSQECGEVENYLNSPWIAFDMYKCKDEAIEITGWSAEELKSANLYMQRPRKGEDDEGSSSLTTQWVDMDNEDGEGNENPEGFYRFTEIWSKTDGVVYTYINGINKRWAREPYAPRTGARFYPNFLLAFHPIDGDRWPQSDVYQLKHLQDEYNRTRSNYALHRMRAIPGMMFDESTIDKKSMEKLAASETQEYTGIKTNKPGTPIQNSIMPKAYNQVDMGLYNTEMIVVEMEKVSGAQDAMQGGVQVEKTATEAQILESGRGARTGARLDTLEDALTEMAEYITQLSILTMDQADAMRYAGPDAVWVDMTTEEALTLFNITIKAGSTGKPKALSDREAWGTLMPLIEGMIDRVGHARMQGQEWAAKPWIELLTESSKRLDDPLEIEKFLPEVPPDVVQAMSNQPPSEKEEAETRNEDADTLKKLAETLEKNPLFVPPVMQVLQDMNEQGQPQEAPVPMPPQDETIQ